MRFDGQHNLKKDPCYAVGNTKKLWLRITAMTAQILVPISKINNSRDIY